MRQRTSNRASLHRLAVGFVVAVLLAAAVPAQSANVAVCGTVTAYVPAGLVPGVIVIGGRSIPIAAGTTLNGAGLIALGSDLCLSGTLNLSGELVSPSTITVNATASVQTCGIVSAYTAATSLVPGLVVIGGQPFPIAAGVTLDGSGLLTVGANVCLNGTVNGLGQLITPSSITANVATTVSVCGVVTAYTAATASAPGSLTIGGQTFPIAAGTAIDGSGLITVGANLCLNGTLDASGQLVVPSSVTANVSTSVSVCGVVSAYTAATASAPGSLTIGGQTFPIAAGTVISGSSLITAGADLCLTGTLNASGQLVVPSSVSANVSAAVNVCGVVVAYTAATASTPGSITIGGNTFPIAVGTAIDGSGLITVGANLCLNGTVNAAGQLIPPSTITVNAGTSLNVCGVVTAYTAATAAAPGSITIGGQTFSIAPGTVLAGNVQVGANLCLSATINPGGQIGGGSATPNPANPPPTTPVNACGVVTAFTPATSTSSGSITIGGQTFVIAAGTTFGPEVSVGASLCFTLPVTPGGEIAGPGPGSPVPSSPANEIVFPVAARLVGIGGSEWRTDLRVLNHGSAPATVNVEWYPFAPDGRPGPAQTVPIIVNPGVQGVYNNTLQLLFNTDGGGSVKLVSASFEIAAALRLYHETLGGPCPGTFGLFEKGLRRSESLTRGALLLLAQRPAEARNIRTNLGYFNASPDPVQLTLRVFATDGRLLGTRAMTLPSFANDQKSVFAIVDSVLPQDREQQDLYVTFEAQGGLPFLYGSAVYNSTNDALFVSPWQY